MMLSYLEKKARIIQLNSDFVLIKGTNHVGKSCILKSLYRALGAEIKKMPDNWNAPTVILLLYFSVDNVNFKSMLIGNDLFVINPDGSIRFKNKIGSQELSRNITILFGVNLHVVGDEDFNIPVGANYMPFYIDQDSGWTGIWTSFSKVGTLSDKSIVRQYLTGIVDESYFSFKKKLTEVYKEIKKVHDQIRTFKALLNKVNEMFIELPIEYDIKSFKDKTNKYLEKLKVLRESQNKYLRLLQELYSKKTYIELNIEQLKKNITEIEKDFNYALDLDNIVICPTCGAHYTNDMSHRHEFNEDAHICRDMVIQCNNDLDIVNKQINAAIEKSEQINRIIEETQDLIKSNNNDISLEEVIEAKSHSMMRDMLNTECKKQNIRHNQLQDEKIRLEEIIKEYEDSGRKEYAETSFVQYVFDGMKSMGSKVKKESIRFGGRVYATGSALPVSIIAHTFSYLKLIKKCSGPVFMPVVVDEPRQQGIQQQGLNRTVNFMCESIPENGQLIISLADDKAISIPANALIIDLDKTGRVLIEDDYDEVNKEVETILNNDFERLFKT